MDQFSYYICSKSEEMGTKGAIGLSHVQVCKPETLYKPTAVIVIRYIKDRPTNSQQI